MFFKAQYVIQYIYYIMKLFSLTRFAQMVDFCNTEQNLQKTKGAIKWNLFSAQKGYHIIRDIILKYTSAVSALYVLVRRQICPLHCFEGGNSKV